MSWKGSVSGRTAIGNDVQMSDCRDIAYKAVDQLALWSEWAPFADAALVAPRSPGVYQMRVPDGTVVYVGMAGERKGQGLRGRLSIYRRGRGAVSGFGEAALDRALADVTFIEDHLEAVREGQVARAAAWARDAIAWMKVEIRWTGCETEAEALALEDEVVHLLKSHGIWNRVATGRGKPPSVDVGTLSASVQADSDGVTIRDLTRELGYSDNGRAVRASLRKAFPGHVANLSWDPLSVEEVAHVRASLLAKR